MNVLDEFKNYKRKFMQNMNEKLKNLKVEEIKFISTNTFFNDRFNEYLFIRDKTKKSKKIRYENNCD